MRLPDNVKVITSITYSKSEEMQKVTDYFDRYIDAYAQKYKVSKKVLYENIYIPFKGQHVDKSATEINDNLRKLISDKMPEEEQDKLLNILVVRMNLDAVHVATYSHLRLLEVFTAAMNCMISIHHTPTSTLGKTAAPKAGKRKVSTRFFEALIFHELKKNPGITNKQIIYSIMDPDSFEAIQMKHLEGAIFFKANRELTVSSKELFFFDDDDQPDNIDHRSIANMVSRVKKRHHSSLNEHCSASHPINSVTQESVI